MTTQNNHLEKALNQGYDLDFGKVIEKSFENFKKTWAKGGLAFLIMGLFLGALFIGAIFVGLGGAVLSDMFNFESMESAESFKMTSLEPLLLFGYMVLMAVLTALGNVFYAGIFKMIDDAEQNKSVDIDSLFHYFKSIHFTQLLLAGAILGVLATVLLFIFEYIDLAWLGTIFQYVISFFTVLTIPLIIFSNQSALDAIQKSMSLVLKQPLIILGLLIVSLILAMVGLFALCIGIIFTIIYFYIVIYYIYRSAVPHHEHSDLDLIGKIEE
jgi:hypothetical protein